MDKQWIQDIMSQQFTVGTFVNPIRLIMATCLVQSPISNRISRYLVLEYIYRTFADHKEIAERNPNIKMAVLAQRKRKIASTCSKSLNVR